MGIRWDDSLDNLKSSPVSEVGPLMKDTNPSKWVELQEAAKKYLERQGLFDIEEILGL